MRFIYRLANSTGVCVDEPERLLRLMSVRTLNRQRAFEILEPYGHPIDNLRHIHAAILAGAKKPTEFGHKPPSKAKKGSGLMTAEEVREANRRAGWH